MSAALLSSFFAVSHRKPALEARGLAAVARARVENAGLRLLASAVAAAVASSVLGAGWALLWLVGLAIVIWRDRVVFARVGQRLTAGAKPDAEPLLLWTMFQSVYANILAVMLWFGPDNVGATLSVMYLCGGLANAAATLRPSTQLAIAGAGPTIACLLGLPIVDYLFVGPQTALELTPLVGALLLLGFGFNLWRSLAASDRAMAEAEAAHLREQRTAAAAAKAKADMVARVNAELRAPLTALSGGVEHLRRVAKTPSARAHAHALASAEEVVAASLREVSDFEAREPAGASAPRPTDVRALARAAANAFRSAAEDKRLEIFVDLAPDLPGCVEIDAVRVQRILFNLLSNAIRHTAHGGVRLRVVAASTANADHVELKFVVIDTGSGLSRSQLALISGRAREAASAEDRIAGLSICLRLAAAMGARLSARSELGAGSAFALTLEAPVRPGLARLD